LAEQQRVEHLYFGPYHRARETGHLQADEGSFIEAELSPVQRQLAEQAARTVFGHFSRLFDQLLDFSQRALSDPLALGSSIEQEYALALARPESIGHEGPRYSPRAMSGSPHADQAPLLALLDARKTRLGQHRFLAWLEDGPPSGERLKNFIPLWGIDVVSYADFSQLVLRYERPATVAEACINGWVDDLATHGVLYLQDWAALDLDDLLGWKMVEAIAYYFLSDHTEVHRRNMSKVKKLALSHRAPLLRWWLITALEEGGQVLFGVTRKIALELEDRLGVPLNYWAHRHGLVEPRDRTPVEHPFLGEALTLATVRVVREMIETVFDNLEQQFDLSYRIARSRVFTTQPQSLPPTPAPLTNAAAGAQR
jgi:hypothetical protein